jgi:hypothetical protein
MITENWRAVVFTGDETLYSSWFGTREDAEEYPMTENANSRRWLQRRTVSIVDVGHLARTEPAP